MPATSSLPASGERTRSLSAWIPLAGVLLIAAGVIAAVAVGDLELWVMLPLIVGGWGIGFGVAGGISTVLQGWPRRGALAGAVAVSAGLTYALIAGSAAWRDALSSSVRLAAGAVGFALVVATCWLALSLLAEFTVTPKVTASVRRQWVRRDEVSRVRFAASPMRFRTLCLLIGAAVAVGGIAAAVIAITTGDTLLFAGPRFLFVALGLLLGLPLYVVVMVIIRLRQGDAEIAFRRAELELTLNGRSHTYPYRELQRFVWVATGEYARVEVATTTERQSLLVGLAQTPKGQPIGLPDLQPHMIARLTEAGLDQQPTKKRGGRPEVVTFERARATR